MGEEGNEIVQELSAGGLEPKRAKKPRSKQRFKEKVIERSEIVDRGKIIQRLKRLPLDRGQKLDLLDAWDFLITEALSVNYNVYGSLLKTHEIYISVVYIHAAITDQFLKTSELMSRSLASIGDYTYWESSELGKFCQRLESKLADRRAKRQFGSMMNILEKLAKKEDKYSLNAINTYLEATGKKKGDVNDSDGLVVQINTNPMTSDQVKVVDSVEAVIEKGAVEEFVSKKVRMDALGQPTVFRKDHIHGVALQKTEADIDNKHTP